MATPDSRETAAAVERLLGPAPTTSEHCGTIDELLPRLALDADHSRQLILDLAILQRDYERQGLRVVDFQLALASVLLNEATVLFWSAREADPDQPSPEHAAEYEATHRLAGEFLQQSDALASCLSTSILASTTMVFGAIASLCQLVHRERAERREDGDVR